MAEESSYHVLIVGAGMAGLTCAKQLLLDDDDIKVTVVEASDTVGGRLAAAKGEFSTLDLGAEFIHGTGTAFDALLKDLNLIKTKHDMNQIFITSHADGGPDEKPTQTGMYGMYYVEEKLRRYDDSVVVELSLALKQAFESSSAESLGEALADEGIRKSLLSFAESSYGNSAGCSELSNISLPMLRHFERHWEEKEMSGDYILTTPLHQIPALLLDQLRHYDRFSLLTNWIVTRIRQDASTVTVTGSGGETLSAHVAAVTVPPTVLKELDMQLPDFKRQALDYIGFCRIVKVFVKFSKRLWPSHVQTIVCADQQVIPEIWFRDVDDGYCVMIGFLSSRAADSWIELTTRTTQSETKHAMADLCICQLSKVLSLPKDSLQRVYVNCDYYDWKANPFVGGGYMFPVVGCTVNHLRALAAPHERLVFAGEATNTDACCTVQASMETGLRAASEMSEILRFDPLR